MNADDDNEPYLEGPEFEAMVRDNVDGVLEIDWANGEKSEPVGYWILAVEPKRFRLTFTDDPEKKDAWWEGFSACKRGRLIMSVEEHMALLLSLP